MAAAVIRRSGPGGQSFFSSEKAAVVLRNIHTSVWWDINDCKVPKGCDASSISGNITAALAKLNYSTPIAFSAYGNMNRIPLKVQDALYDSGVSLIHLPGDPNDHKNIAYCNLCTRNIKFDMEVWIEDHPPPATCLFITGDKSLSRLDLIPYSLGTAKKSDVNVLLASPRKIDYRMLMKLDPRNMWRWTTLRAGGAPEWTSHCPPGSPHWSTHDLDSLFHD